MNVARDVLRTAPRLASVLGLLARHGFSGLLRGQARWPGPREVREALERLGVVFMKLGQVLSTRRDILPPAYIAELERLQDRVRPESAEVVRPVLEAELGQPVEALFAAFEWSPLAAATIAQVHSAKLEDGRRVVVKIQRPGLEARITEDLAVLAYLASALDTLVPALRPFDAPAMVREFHTSLLRELDFRREARNVRRFRHALAGVPGLWIPDVIPERSAARVIAFEHSTGRRLAEYVAEHPEQRSALARRLAQLLLRQVFEEGLFHADPHPGNFFVLEDGTICLHDFGMIGELDERMRETLTELLTATVRGDTRGVANAYFELGLVGPEVDRSLVEDEIAGLLRELREQPLAEVSVGHALESLLRLGTRHRIRNPGVVLLLSRAFITMEAVMRGLDPQLDVLAAFREAVPGLARRRFAPGRLLADAADMARSADQLLREAPAASRQALRRFADGDLGRVQIFEHPDLVAQRSHLAGLLLRTVGAGFLTLAGAVLLQAQGWRLAVGLVLLAAGLGGLAATAVRSKLHR